MKQKIIKFIKKFLEIDELEGQLTQVDKELQDCIGEVDGMRMDIDDKPNFYDMESYVDDQVNENFTDLSERIDSLEGKIES